MLILHRVVARKIISRMVLKTLRGDEVFFDAPEEVVQVTDGS